MRKLTHGGCETLAVVLLVSHIILFVFLAVYLGMVALPIAICSYLLSIYLWFILSRDIWVKTLMNKAFRKKITYMNGYYYVSGEDYYFRITSSDMLIVYHPGRIPIYSTAGLLAINILKQCLRKPL